MAGQAATMCLLGWRKPKGFNDAADNGDKRIAVVITERGEPMTPAAEICGLGQGYFPAVSSCSKFSGNFIPIAGRSVQCMLGETKLAIRLHEHWPGKGREPRPLHRPCSPFSCAFWISSTVQDSKWPFPVVR